MKISHDAPYRRTLAIVGLLLVAVPFHQPRAANDEWLADHVGPMDPFEKKPFDPALDQCSNWDALCSSFDSGDGASTPLPNIILAIADNAHFCGYGFMGGLCDNTPVPLGDCSQAPCSTGLTCVQNKCIRPCNSNLGCGTDVDGPGSSTPGASRAMTLVDATCMSSAEFARTNTLDVATVPLRLNDPACRNRDPTPLRNDWCTDPVGDATVKAREDLTFDRTDAPCFGTPTMAERPPDTPFIDELAAQGAVFPRAHLSGNECKTGRTTLQLGKANRHLGPLNGKRGNKLCDPNPTNGTAAEYNGIPCWLPGRCSNAKDRTCVRGSADPQLQCQSPGVCEVAGASTGGAGVADDDGHGGYIAMGWGKGETVNVTSKAGQGGLDVGEMKGSTPKTGYIESGVISACKVPGRWLPSNTVGDPDRDYECDAHLRNQRIPWLYPPIASGQSGTRAAAFGELDYAKKPVGGSFFKEIAARTIGTSVEGHRYQRRPFFLWWAPHTPHKGGAKVPQTFFNVVSSEIEGEHRNYMGRTLVLDLGIGAMVHGLRRRCVCRNDAGVPSPTAQSLWDNTIFIMVSDNGYLLATDLELYEENLQRTMLLINEPWHRQQANRGMVFNEQIANVTDVLATISSYGHQASRSAWNASTCGPTGAGQCGTDQTYPFRRNLASYFEDGKADRERIVRNLDFGHSAEKPFIGTGEHYVQNRPGLFGVCSPPTTQFTDVVGRNHVRPCVIDGDCNSGGKCWRATYVPASGSTPATGIMTSQLWGKCSSDPSRTCVHASDCCVPGTACPSSVTCDPPDVGSQCAGGSVGNTVFPCTNDAQCADVNIGGTACVPAPARKGGRCVNRPDTLCARDGDCDDGLCDGTRCEREVAAGTTPFGLGPSFADFAPLGTAGNTVNRLCSGDDSQCVPRHVCRPITLRIERHVEPLTDVTTGSLSKVTDIEWDPDEAINLLNSGTDYLLGQGADLSPEEILPNASYVSLGSKVHGCLKAFYDLLPATNRWNDEAGALACALGTGHRNLE